MQSRRLRLDRLELLHRDLALLRHGRHQRAQLHEQRAERGHLLQVRFVADLAVARDPRMHGGARAQRVGELVAPRVGRVERQRERERQRDRDADQHVHRAPQAVDDLVVAVPGDDHHRDRRQQRDIAGLADRVIRADAAGDRHHRVDRERRVDGRVQQDQQQPGERADRRAERALGGLLADVAVMLEAADDDQHGDRRPFAVRNPQAGRQADRHEDRERDARGVDQLRVPVTAIGVQQRAQRVTDEGRQPGVGQGGHDGKRGDELARRRKPGRHRRLRPET